MSIWWKGLVGRQSESDGSEAITRLGRTGEAIVAGLKGQYAEKVQRGEVFSASAAAITIPQIANNLVSVFSIFNPIGSGRILEILGTEIQNLTTVGAPTVVNLYSWYYSGPALAGLHTFTTLGVTQNRRLGDGAANAGKFYSALTHSGTPILAAAIGGHGAITNPAGIIRRAYNGSLLVPPGVVISIAGSTAASEAAGIAATASWAEHTL